MAREAGIDCQVTMIAHSNWRLCDHAKEPDVRFNIKYGKYDYVILQEYSQPFEEEAEYERSMRRFCGWIRRAGARPVIYMTWSRRDEPEAQETINRACRRMAEELDCLLAPVGEIWWQRIGEGADLYFTDGQHPSKMGTAFVAEQLWRVIADEVSA